MILVGFSMFDEKTGGEQPWMDDDFDLAAVLDYPRAVLIAVPPGGLNRLMRTVEAVTDAAA